MYIVILINFWAARTLGHEPVVSFSQLLGSKFCLACMHYVDILCLYTISVYYVIDFSQLLGVTNFAFQQPTL